MVDSVATLTAMLDTLATAKTKPAPTEPPSLYLDVEGVNLGRHGSVAILSIYFLPTATTYLVDIYQLGNSAFYTTNGEGHCLKSILESSDIPKVFFDVRNDSDALFHLHGISLDGVIDLQVMELVTRDKCSEPAYDVFDLARCVERDLPESEKTKIDKLKCKEEGTMLFDPRRNGSYEVLNKRPLDPKILNHWSQDVAVLSSLWNVYVAKLSGPSGLGFLRHMVRKGSTDRVKLSQTAGYDSRGPGKRLGPWGKGKDQIEKEMDEWNEDIVDMAIHEPAVHVEQSFGRFQWV